MKPRAISTCWLTAFLFSLYSDFFFGGVSLLLSRIICMVSWVSRWRIHSSVSSNDPWLRLEHSSRQSSDKNEERGWELKNIWLQTGIFPCEMEVNSEVDWSFSAIILISPFFSRSVAHILPTTDIMSVSSTRTANNALVFLTSDSARFRWKWLYFSVTKVKSDSSSPWFHPVEDIVSSIWSSRTLTTFSLSASTMHNIVISACGWRIWDRTIWVPVGSMCRIMSMDGDKDT